MRFKSWKETDLGSIPSHWNVRSLSDCIITIIDYRGKTPKKIGGDWSATPTNYRALSAKNIKGGVIVREETIRYLDQDLYFKWMKEEVQKNDILMTSEAPLGELMFWNSEEKIVLSQRVYGIRPNVNIVYPRYLYLYMNSKVYQNELDSRASGTTVTGIRQTELLKTRIILPSLEEQKAIADILSSLDEKIELNNQMNETLEEMAQALFKRWFVDFEFPNEEGQSYKSSGGEMVESELGMIPKGWEVKQIDNLATITRGASPRPIQEYMSEEGIPWVKISDATNSGSKYLIETKEFIKEEGRRKSREVTQGTLILSNSATPGIPKIMLIDACVHDGWLIFRNYKDTTIEFMYYVLLHEQKRILALSNGSVFRNLKTDILKNYKIVVPDKRVLLKFTKIIEEINENIKIKVLENKSLMEIRDNLLPKLMSGEIRVSDLKS